MSLALAASSLAYSPQVAGMGLRAPVQPTMSSGLSWCAFYIARTINGPAFGLAFLMIFGR